MVYTLIYGLLCFSAFCFCMSSKVKSLGLLGHLVFVNWCVSTIVHWYFTDAELFMNMMVDGFSLVYCVYIFTAHNRSHVVAIAFLYFVMLTFNVSAFVNQPPSHHMLWLNVLFILQLFVLYSCSALHSYRNRQQAAKIRSCNHTQLKAVSSRA